METLLTIVQMLPWLIALGGAALMASAHRFASRATRVNAVVVNLNEERIPHRRPSGKPTILQRPVFEYPGPDGAPLRAEAFAPSPGFKLTLGARCEILVDPDLPEIARLSSSAIYAPGMVLVGIGLGFVLLTQLLPG